MNTSSHPGSNKATYNMDTTSYQNEFSHNIKLGEKLWQEESYYESIQKTKRAITVGKFLVDNTPEGSLKTVFLKKTLEIVERVQVRQKEMESIKQKANEQANKNGNKIIKNDDKDKLQASIADAILTQNPNVKWSDIIGLEEAKKFLKEAVILPKKLPHIFKGALTPWKGVLLYGPPGTGKTYLAKACATEANGTFFSISTSDLVSKYVGESEKLIKTLFELARAKQPSIIFIDEIDSLCSKGEAEHSIRIVKEFLAQMDGVKANNQGILVLGATNEPWKLDFGIRRRFERKVYISLPEKQTRYQILKKGLKDNRSIISEDMYRQFAQKTQVFSCADVSVMVKDLVYQPLRHFQACKKFKKLPNGKIVCARPEESGSHILETQWFNIPESDLENIQIPQITNEDLKNVLKKAKPTVNLNHLKQYQDWTNQFGLEGA